ncbi:retrovirus-related pol polyprotein from transposon RE2 [Tanacetum coccineum]
MALKSYGFVQSLSDYSLFSLWRGDTHLNVLVYADDLIISGNNSNEVTTFKAYLSRCFPMKDLGVLKYFLGIEADQNSEGIFLCQRKYTSDIISEVGLLGAEPANIPLEQHHRLALADGEEIRDPKRYRRLFMQHPIEEHWQATTKKQHTVSRSSSEAEYRSMATTTCELKWLKRLLNSLGVAHPEPMRLFCDNQAALDIAANHVFHERTKHIEFNCHFVRDEILSGNLAPSYVHTSTQLADIFTKALGNQQFHDILSKLGIHNPHAPT